MGRKFLEDLGWAQEDYSNDSRVSRWAEEREEYGFDERDTWSLDYTMLCLLYERLKLMREFTNYGGGLNTVQISDTEFMTVEEVSDQLIALSEKVLKGIEEGTITIDEIHESSKQAWVLWSKSFSAFWW